MIDLWINRKSIFLLPARLMEEGHETTFAPLRAQRPDCVFVNDTPRQHRVFQFEGEFHSRLKRTDIGEGAREESSACAKGGWLPLFTGPDQITWPADRRHARF